MIRGVVNARNEIQIPLPIRDVRSRVWIGDFKKVLELSERELARGTRRYRPSGAATAALEGLVQDGLGEWFYPPQPDTGGAPHRAFRLFHPGPAGDNTPDFNSADGGIVTVATVTGGKDKKRNGGRR